MTDTHELAEKIFIASMANPYWAEQKALDSNLAGWAYDAAREFIAVKEKNTALNVAQPEPPRLPDYKPGQWIAVWNNASPVISKYCGFSDSGKCKTWESGNYIQHWDNHCTLEELPAVLAKMGEQK